MTMAIKKVIWVLFGILVISAWVLGSVTQVGAETMNFRVYHYVVKSEKALVGDVEGHMLL
jgi:ABC-type microcin C transport system permease subunit YejE